MRKCAGCIAIPVLVLALIGTASGEMKSIGISDREAGISTLDQSDARLTFQVSIGTLASYDVETERGTFSRLLLPGFHASHAIGDPELPMINRLFEIPYGAEVSVEAARYETREIVLSDFGIMHPLMPAQPSVFKNQDPATLLFHINDEVYLRDAEIGRDLAQVEEVGLLRGVRIGRLRISPVRYNPVSGTIEVRENIEVVVRFAGTDRAGELELKAKTYSPFFEPIFVTLAGSRDEHDDHPDHFSGSVTYVIVSDPMFESQLQPFIEWKTERGFKVVEAYTGTPEVGTTTTSIRNYLHDLYNGGTPSDPAPTFVLFVGDVAQIPAFNLSGYSDLSYCDVTGDGIPDMYYGRFSASNVGDLQPQIDKTLEYEKYLMPDPSYLDEVVMTAGYDATYASTYGNGQINYGTTHYFNAAHGITSHTYLYPGSGSSSAAIISNVSDGVSYINYTAHGSQTSWSNPSFTISNINSLGNTSEYCLAVGNCCLTSSFQISECFGEAWLRAVDEGGIGYIGASESTLWDEDYWWGVGYGPVVSGGATYEQTGLGTYDGMFHDHGEGIGQWYVCQDAHVFCGNLAVEESNSSYNDYYWEIYNLMGDPSLSVYFSVPDPNGVTLPSEIGPADTEVSVGAEPKSYVGLTKDGVLLGSGLIGVSGTALIPISGQGTEGNVRVVITCQNRVPYTVDLPIQTLDGPQLYVDHHVILDAGGDGDGAIDAGENIELITYLRNSGNDPATSVTALLTMMKSVVVTDNSETWGTIVVDQIKPCDDSFKLEVSNDTPDQTVLDFDLAITSAETTWVREFSLTVEAPVIELASTTIDDGGNGVADPSETLDITFHFTNTGHEDAVNFSGVLRSPSILATVNQDSAFTALVPEGGAADLAGYSVTIDPSCPVMTTLYLFLDLTGDLGYAETLMIPLPISPFFDDFETDQGWTVSSTASTGAWERGDPEGTFSGSEPCQTEDDHSAAPGTQCMATGLLAGSGYGSYDIDGGNTVLTSPLFDLSGALSATVEYWRWYTNNLGNAPDEDWWTVEVTDNGGADWIYLEHTQSSNNSWQKFSFDLGDSISMTNQVRFRFTAADEVNGSIVEAALDDFLLYAVKDDITAVAGGVLPDVPVRARLFPNNPNPFNPTTTIRYELNESGNTGTTLKVYDISGRRIRTLVNEVQPAGTYHVTWNGENDNGYPVASGVYFYVLNSGSKNNTRKMVLLR